MSRNVPAQRLLVLEHLMMRMPSRSLRSWLAAILACSGAMVSSSLSLAAQYRGEARTFQQPDGKNVEVRLFGTEFYVRAESPEGYALVRDAGTGGIFYASLGVDGRLSTSGIPYEGSMSTRTAALLAQAGIHKGLRPSAAVVNETVALAKQQLWKDRTPSSPDIARDEVYYAAEAKYSATMGSGKGLVVLVDFSDRVGTIPAAEYDKAFNGDTYDSLGSIRTWTEAISYQKYSASHTIMGYMRAAYPTSHYTGGAEFDYSASAELMKQVFAYIDQEADLTSYATNGAMPSLVVIYPGAEIAKVWATGLWPHAGEGGYTTSEKVKIPNAFISNGGTRTPMDLDTFRHELGHSLFGWPDTYDYDNDSASAGGYATETTLPCAPFRMWSGWITVIDLVGMNQSYSLPANGDTCLRYKNASNANEYFIMEYMKKDSVKRADAPDEGLLIWHVDEKGDNSLQDMTATRHYELSVEQADGLFELEKNGTKRANDLFHAGNKDKFDDTSTPNSKWWNGSVSGLKVCNVGALDPSINLTVGCDGTAGTSGTGGVMATGGAGGTGGSSTRDAGADRVSRDAAVDTRDAAFADGSGGIVASGGSKGMGGASAAGGIPSTGGTTGTGGGVGPGGSQGAGGTHGTGGTTATGGAMASGGASATVGSFSMGGSSGGAGTTSGISRDAGADRAGTPTSSTGVSKSGCSCALGTGSRGQGSLPLMVTVIAACTFGLRHRRRSRRSC
ncbi:MAG TPA: hypothetical protein VF550_17925 [Polyangia bacterium]